MNVIYVGTSWHRQVVMADSAGNPIDPTEIEAILCPNTPITVTTTIPGVYVASLSEIDTAAIVPGATQWEMFGRVNGSYVPLVTERVLVVDTCLAGTP